MQASLARAEGRQGRLPTDRSPRWSPCHTLGETGGGRDADPTTSVAARGPVFLSWSTELAQAHTERIQRSFRLRALCTLSDCSCAEARPKGQRKSKKNTSWASDCTYLLARLPLPRGTAPSSTPRSDLQGKQWHEDPQREEGRAFASAAKHVEPWPPAAC